MTGTLIVVAFTLVIVFFIALGLWSRQRQSEAWREFATQIGGEFTSGGLFRANKVQAQIEEQQILLDTYTVSSGDSSTTYTRIRAPFQNTEGFQFTISRTGLVSKIGKALGAQDIEIGDSSFDDDFTIQSNNESKVRTLFTNGRIRQLIQGQKSIRLSLKGNELHFQVQGVIRDVERLKSLFELFKETLQQLDGGTFG